MNNSNIEPELLLLIARFLESTPCNEAAESLKKELDKYELLPKRRTWEGNPLPCNYKDTALLHKNLSPESLPSLIKYALKEHNKRNKSYYRSPLSLIAASHSAPTNSLQRSRTLGVACHTLFSLGESNVFGNCLPRKLWPATCYRSCSASAKVFGHLGPIFCVTFDKKGEIVFTGSDDHLIKAWHLASGRLLATFRGHHLEISDLAVSADNGLLASGSCDRSVRVWDLKTTANIAVLKGHTGTITAVAFSPMYSVDGDKRTPAHYFCYVASGGADGVICLWRWRSYDGSIAEKPIKLIEKSRAGVRILSMSFSEGGFYLVAGSSDYVVRVYTLSVSFEKVAELEGHAEAVDSLQFANTGMSFATASCDGSARIFHYERQHWRQLVINCSQTLTKEKDAVSRVQVCMIRWSCNDEFLIASVSDKSVKVFDSSNGQLVRVLKGHKNQVFCIACSNFDPNLIVTGGYDGLIILWNIQTGEQLFTYQNKAGANFEECGAIHALTLSPDDSLSLAAADSYGHMLLFSFGHYRPAYRTLPEQMFFHTDYRPVCYGPTELPLDQADGRPLHEMPPPWLIDSEGAPYPSNLQQLVPGREKLIGPDNVPEIVVDDEGYHEVTNRSVADAAAGQPAQNLPAAWSNSKPLCRLLDSQEVANELKRAAAHWDAESCYYEDESTRKPPKKHENFLSENHRLRSWDHRLHDDNGEVLSHLDRVTIPVVNRLCARALYDTDSDNDSESRPSRAGAASNDSSVIVERGRRAAAREARRNALPNDDDESSRRHSSRPTHRSRAIISDDNEDSNDAPGPSARRPSRTRRGAQRNAEHYFNEDSRHRPDLHDESSRASSDASVTEALNRMASGTSSSGTSTFRDRSHQRVPEVVVNGSDDDDGDEPNVYYDESSETASSESSSEVNSDAEWRPSPVSNGHRRDARRSHRQNNHQQEESQPTRSTRQEAINGSAHSTRQRRRKKKTRQLSSQIKKSESPVPGRYSLRDHSKPSTSRQDVPGPSRSSALNGLPARSTRQTSAKEEPVYDEPSDRAKRYKNRVKKGVALSPRHDPYNDASSSIPDSDMFEASSSTYQHHSRTNGTSTSKSHNSLPNGFSGPSKNINLDMERFQHIPPWMTQTSPTVRFPFLPQIGDEVVYIWRGHRLYIDAVQATQTHPIKRSELNNLPYNLYRDELSEEEPCRVVDLSIELVLETACRLICVKLLVLKTEESDYPIELSFRYHDVPNVVDFIILRQWYDLGVHRQWSVGDKFRSLIDNQWYTGVIVRRQPPAPGCTFRMYRVIWDLEDDEDALSPWDIEPISKSRTNNDGPSSSADETSYVPIEEDWPPVGDRDSVCHRILGCLDQVMAQSMSEFFNLPVDYETYGEYLRQVAYPMDLTLIRERLHYRYYRHIEAIKWDVGFILKNADIFNVPTSKIVRNAAKITQALNAIIDDPDCVDALEKLPRNGRKRVLEDDDDDDDDGTQSDEKSAVQPPAKRANMGVPGQANWETLCYEVLSRMWKSPDSAEFRSAVDLKVYPNYATIIEHPIDLNIIRRRLQGHFYRRSSEFIDDVRLMFDNSRKFNTDKKSPIFIMTSKLIEVFDNALLSFQEMLDAVEDPDDDDDTDSGARGASSRRSKRYQTRLATGTIPYSNVHEQDEMLDSVVEATIGGRRHHYRRLQQAGRADGASGSASGSSLRRPATRHMS